VWRLFALGCAACRLNFDELVDAPAADACPAIPGLVAYFPMEQGDIIGNVLLDRSGNAHNGVITGTPAPVLSPGQIGDALDFRATTDAYVDIAGLTVPTTTGSAVTVAGWFERPGMPPNDVLFDFPPPDLGNEYDIWLINGSLCFNTANGECWGLAGAFTDRWVHVAAIFHNDIETASELYIDGAAQALTCTQTTCTTARTVASSLRLGSKTYYMFYGQLDEVRVYDHALAPAEIANLAAGLACE
jgi:hypothetical protein